jgi:hypothetical protein
MSDNPDYLSDRDQVMTALAEAWEPPAHPLGDQTTLPHFELADDEEPPPDGLGFWVDETDGFLYDADGEILELDSEGNVFNADGRKLGHISEVDQTGGRTGPRFEVTNREEAEWALARRSDIEASILALKARLEGYTRNLQAQIQSEQRKLRWWEYRFESGVIGVARRLLKGKGKTAQFDNGRIAFRTVPPSTQIIDESAAIAWAEKWCPAIVKRKAWVTATDIKKAKAEVEADTEAPQVLPFLATSEPRESISIKTGIERKI